MKILLIGANGQLATDLVPALRHAGSGDVFGVTRDTVDIRYPKIVEQAVSSVRPDVVINTAAYHNVELCEDEPAEAMLVNGTAVGKLAEICKQQRCTLVHFSTDFVFDGTASDPYKETDTPGPQSAYAKSKLEGERLIQKTLQQHFIIRTCGLYGVAGSKIRAGNFVEKILKRAESGAEVSVVGDQFVTPTFTVDLSEGVARLVGRKEYGLYHITNEGECSWHEFAQEALRLSGSSAIAKKVSSAEFKTKAVRPAYSVLSKEKLYALGIPKLPHWKDALKRYIVSRAATSV